MKNEAYFQVNEEVIESWHSRIKKNVVNKTSTLSESRVSLYLFIFASWLLSLVWFHPRLSSLLQIADTGIEYGALLFFILFTELAWLYAFYNVGVVIFATIYHRKYRETYLVDAELPENPPDIALLYTTCNDFRETSVLSCVEQDYANFTVYILDDSSNDDFKHQVDEFAAKHPNRVKVVRRANRKGFKAGNLNYGLGHATAGEPFFAIADADEVLPKDFLTRTMKRILTDANCGFVQANHQSNPDAPSSLSASLGAGIDAHWRWYHPLRNRYGFVMLLGHGALLRREAWEDIGGFPEIVSEDLAFALKIREHGWRGHFAEDIICYEDFPETIRAFRVRHMKWTRGTCEFLRKQMGSVIRSRNISLVEKFDVIFPTINLPLSLFYFLYLIDANLIMAMLFSRPQSLTLALGSTEINLPTNIFEQGFSIINGLDFFAITILTLTAPILCFILEMYRRPVKLFNFLAKSTAIYGTLGPLSCVGVVLYAITGKAVFHVTADVTQTANQRTENIGSVKRLKANFKKLLEGSHPDSRLVQGFELMCGFVFGVSCLLMMQISFFGLCIGFMMLPIMHHISWENQFLKRMIYMPFTFLLLGLFAGGLSVFGMQTVLFGYGFHF